jgi:flagellar hook-associated protein 2
MATTATTSATSTGALANLNMIDVTALVNRVMTAEKIPQDNLKTSLATGQSKLTAYQSLSTTVKSLQSAAESIIGSVYATSPTWASLGASSSSSNVAATASATATAGNYTFDVTSLATPAKVLFGTSVKATDPVSSIGGTITSTSHPTKPITIDSSMTLAELATAINDADAGVNASLIKTGTDGSGNDLYRLQLTASSTGTANDFTFSGIDQLGSVTTTAAADAKIQFGPDALNDVATSSSNTFTNVFPGVTFTTSKVEDGVTLTVADDVSAMSSQVQALVTAYNSAYSALQSATTYNLTDKSAGLLMGESSVRSLTVSLPGAFLSAIAPITTDLGLSVDKYGVVSFDSTAFATAMASDPTASKAALVDWGYQIGQITNDATAAVTGSLSRAISSSETQIEDLNTKIADWDQRLKDRTTLLTQLYASINANLATLKTTSDWISDQITALTTKTN